MPEAGAALQGNVHGGNQAVVGARVYLFAANTTGYGGRGIAASTANASVSMLNSAVLTNQPGASGVDANGRYYVTTGSDGGFSITSDYSCTAGDQVYLYVEGGNTGAGVNSSESMMAVLGSCPAAGTFAGTVPFLWVNEVTTVAAAYALSGFASDATHVSSSGTALAKVGIANAFAGAANLANVATGTALTVPVSNTGGTAPQTLVNTVADILTACVNSNDAQHANCDTLFEQATTDGVATTSVGGATNPTETASAAIHMVHYPTSNVAALYALLPSTGAAFVPALSTAPTTWTAVLKFATSASYGFTPAIDATGNLWIAGGSTIAEMSPVGAKLGLFASFSPTSVQSTAISSTGVVWAADFSKSTITAMNTDGSVQGTYSSTSYTNSATSIIAAPNGDVVAGSYGTPYALARFNSSGTFLKGYDYSSLTRGYGPAFDVSGNLWAAGQSSKLCKVPATGTITCFAPAGANFNYVYSVALDKTGNVWAANLSGNTITGLTSSGALIANVAVGGTPRSVIVDGGNAVWAVSQSAQTVYQMDPTTGAIVQTIPSSASGYLAADGAGNIWGTNLGGYVFELMGAGTPTVTPVVANLMTPYGTSAVNRP